MKIVRVLYSTMSVVQWDGNSYYSNPIQAAYKRYLTFGNDITVICHIKKVEIATHDKLDEGILRLKFVKKINSAGALLHRHSTQNKTIVKQEVLKADVCIVHLPSPHGNQVIKYAKKYGKPFLVIVCGCPWDSYWYYNWRGKLFAPYAYLTMRKSLWIAPYAIYVTNTFLQHRYPTKGHSIGCSNVNIHTGISSVIEKRQEIIRQRQNSGEVLRIGTAAAIDVPYKSQKDVILALALLKKEGKKYEYHLIGRGDSKYLETVAKAEGVADQVFFHGTIPHEKVLDFLDTLDIYVQPSKQEGLPRAMIEAMSRGCLCLGAHTAGIPELLEPEYIFGKGNVKEIVEILRNISFNKLNEQAFRNFEEAKKYDVDVLNKRRQTFFETIKMDIEKT